tara:strand:+ start:797 stop:919 length:123 start_codon:yes stop_codon:yes gene_type:complete
MSSREVRRLVEGIVKKQKVAIEEKVNGTILIRNRSGSLNY